MDPVVQKDDFGCGAACVAFVANQSYDDVVAVLGKKKAQAKGFYCRELRAYLENRGLIYSFCYAKQDKQPLAYRDGSIIFIRRSKRFSAGHYLAYYEGRWMDPWYDFSSNRDVNQAYAGYRKRLPGTIQYILYRK